ncbi:hypothetical protein ACNSOO_04710 [Aliarcobacter lanthieri]|uniref:hypothetical protein n=1 Tax=Aliarcobacter lanthieri TaxID=1355374 RepID=UPI003AAFA256
MSRKGILEKINKILIEEHGKELREDDLLIKSDIDSFGYAIFWLEIQNSYKLFKDEVSEDEDRKRNIDFVNGIDYSTYKVKDLIDRIEQCL